MFKVANSNLHLFPHNSVQGLRVRLYRRGSVPVHRLNGRGGSRDGFLQSRRSAPFAPTIIFVVAGIDFYSTIANLEHARSQFVDEVAVMRNKNYRACVLA